MKIMTYLGFTFMSILIQFCVMDYIHEKNNHEIDRNDLNTTSQKKTFSEILNSLKEKPHALYYRMGVNDKLNNKKSVRAINAYSNTSIVDLEYSTSATSTIFDAFYDDNISTTEDSFTTESLYTTTEIDNVTEINFFDKRNESKSTETSPKKSLRNVKCECDFLYQICDINCCCDSDCTEKDRIFFAHCKDNTLGKEPLPTCYQTFKNMHENNYFENLFCIVKTNLPAKRYKEKKKYETNAVDYSHKWHNTEQSKNKEFQRKPYRYGDPIWVLKEGYIWYIDIPYPMVNNYCSSRKPVLLLNQETVKCDVHIKDLEMIQILKTSEEASCISVTEKSINSTALNCATLHCTNWTIIICDENGDKCVDYNKTAHEPVCTESYCTNIAFRVNYVFNYFDSKIIKATVIFHTRKISTHITIMSQEISVKFLLTNESADSVIEISGNPGYIYGLSVISSATENNHTANFFNSTFKGQKYLIQTTNRDGLCAVSNNTRDSIKFGVNTRTKCKYVFTGTVVAQNSTTACDDIERYIKNILGLTEKVHVSPKGNPLNIKDDEWLSIKSNILEKDLTYGQFLAKNSRLRCYNLITRISYLFTFADVSQVKKREDQITGVNVTVSTQNVTFNVGDVSTVLTIDVNFIDVTKPKAYEYAAGPHLNIHLPRDFFFPFPSNGLYSYKLNAPLIMLCFAIHFQIK